MWLLWLNHRIPRSDLNIDLARQPSVSINQNVKKHKMHAPDLNNKSILVNSGVDSRKDYPGMLFFFFFKKKIYK